MKTIGSNTSKIKSHPGSTRTGRRAAGTQKSGRSIPTARIKIKRILVPVDFARESLKPLNYAASIAKTHGAKVLLLHVASPKRYCIDCGYGPVDREFPDGPQIREDRAHLRRIASRQLGEDLLEDICIRSGAAVVEILRAARELKPDLIVLYAHEEPAEGSIGTHEIVERITRTAPCPVLVVRPHEQDFLAPSKSRRATAARPSRKKINRLQ